ncbi:hypothetical protein [Maritimibacter alexandrii]|uniref:hypothetical protein n=1 Tax=Maritimibacter alexandrii TaxID=2570355 RepID=UPI001107D0D4|nr:hypothetical protein [Maritimibacter alexandrii]
MMMDCGYAVGLTLVLAIAVAVAAWFVGRATGRMREANAWVILAIIVVSLVVLQLGARLAVMTLWVYGWAGVDPLGVCGGQLQVVTFAGTLVVIAAYVAAFFWSFRRTRKGA